ncbi:sensor histidine kinase [Streptomyces sp. N2-109]|uniref:histidine kinase n=1 Tax=Streptomyces gossypii TaxID=2883101 RepID=A0ABT2JR39_9ACTN|nr:sensor histidine kinase [Streptomyces gossypii]MCT2589954.1 sensor histidine kinase [Streptomyces gossypii]
MRQTGVPYGGASTSPADRGGGAARDGMLVAGVVLALLAIAETVLRTTVAKTDGSAVFLPLALLVGLCCTAPLTAARHHAGAAATVITAATVPAAVLHRGPLATGLVALFTVWTVLARRRVRRVRAEAAERDTSRQDIEHRLLEFSARGERARIARELHDVVAHHISMISVQAETARLTTPGMPEEGAKKLLAIGDTARTALTEMRRLLGVLREDAGAGAEPTRQPQPGLQQLLELLDETRESAGASTRLIVTGRVTALDPGLELTAYRIVQEALTNVRRHAPGAAADVEIVYGPDTLHLRVRDNGPGPTASRARRGENRGDSQGHGLLGMRERAASVGGELRTSRAPVGGFLVEATLPTTPGTDSTETGPAQREGTAA